MMSERQWYASDEHLQTEMSYAEYKNKNKQRLTPSFDELMRM